MNRLAEYVYGDPRARRTRDRVSMAISFLWYSIALLLLRFDPAHALMQSVVLLVAIQAATTVHYCLSRRKESREVTEGPPQRTRIAAAVGFALSVAAAVGFKNRIEAAIIDDRLLRIARDPNPDSVRAAAMLVSIANANGIVLSKHAVDAAVTARLTLAGVSDALETVVRREARTRGTLDEPFWMTIRKKTDVGHIFLDGISGEEVNLRAFGMNPADHSLFPPQLVAFIGPIGAGISSPTRPGVPLIEVLGSEYNISVSLDGKHCKNVMFVNCTLTYTGMAIQLENVGFYKCKFDFSANLVSQRLAQEILADPSVHFEIVP